MLPVPGLRNITEHNKLFDKLESIGLCRPTKKQCSADTHTNIYTESRKQK